MITSTLVRVAPPSSRPGAAPVLASVLNAAITGGSASGRNCAGERRPSSTSRATRSTARANCRAPVCASPEVTDFAGCEGVIARCSATAPGRASTVFRMTPLRQETGRVCDTEWPRTIVCQCVAHVGKSAVQYSAATPPSASGGSNPGARDRNPPSEPMATPGRSSAAVLSRTHPRTRPAAGAGERGPRTPPEGAARRANQRSSASLPAKSVGRYSTGLVVQSCPEYGS